MEEKKSKSNERLAQMMSALQSKKIAKSQNKTKIDSRFQSMFEDDRFKLTSTVDKRGREVKKSTNEDLKRFYELSSEESDEEDDSSGEDDEKSGDDDGNDAKKSLDGSDKIENKRAEKPSTSSVSKVKSEEVELPKEVKKRLRDLKVDYARGEARLFSDSSSDSDDSEEEEVEEAPSGLFSNLSGLEEETEMIDESTRRLAVCNMNWDRIRAVDLMVVFHSFLPATGTIDSVTVYPSKFGLERMKEEEVKGPTELVKNSTPDDDVEDDEEHSGHVEKLREYQLNRLRYYFAVVVCDSVETADKLYGELDGLEYESSGTKMDLRYIPDDEVFDQEPREVCHELPDFKKYKPRLFGTPALQHTHKIESTWDETDPDRTDFLKNIYSSDLNEINDEELRKYVAVSSSEDDDDDHEENKEAAIQKYRDLLSGIETAAKNKTDRKGELQITWDVELEKKTESLAKNESAKSQLTPFEQYLEKRKEKKKKKRQQKLLAGSKTSDGENSDDDDIPSDIDMNDPYFAEEFKNGNFKKSKKSKLKSKESDEPETNKPSELELLVMDDDDEKNLKHFSLKKIQESESVNDKSSKKKWRKRKLKDEKTTEELSDDFQMNLNDNRFSAIYTNPMYHIDPSDPHYRKTKTMQALIDEKFKRRKVDDVTTPSAISDSSKRDQVKRLIQSVKRKSQK